MLVATSPELVLYTLESGTIEVGIQEHEALRWSWRRVSGEQLEEALMRHGGAVLLVGISILSIDGSPRNALQGRWAGLELEGGEVREMRPGDYVEIPAHRRHRVAWTSSEEPTVWLAVHY